MRKVFADYHIHTTFSPDGKNTMEELCEAALEKGLTELAFTDHYEIYTPGFSGSDHSPLGVFTRSMLCRYRESFEICREKYAGKLELRFGLELGQPFVNHADTQQIMREFSFDYLVASMHKIDDVDLSQQDYRAGDADEVADKNLRAIYRLADESDFDCVAHLDLIRRYSAHQGCPVSIADHEDALRSILRRLIQRGKGLEINTSGLRQGLGDTIPGVTVLRLFRELGGEVVVFGSDAHQAVDLGEDFETARQIAREAGFRRAARFRDRKCSFYEI